MFGLIILSRVLLLFTYNTHLFLTGTSNNERWKLEKKSYKISNDLLKI